MRIIRILMLALVMLIGCAAPPEVTDGGVDLDLDGGAGGGAGAGVGGGGGGGGGGGVGGMNCPTSGTGAIVTTAPCVVFTPAQAGAAASGDNAAKNNYALEPFSSTKGALVVHLNSSLATPASNIADPTKNLYTAAAQAGFHVLALAYRSSLVVGITCSGDAACFGLTRKSIVLGKPQPGGPNAVMNIQEDEGIVWRLEASIRFMVALHPNVGWEQFLVNPMGSDPATRIAWSKVIVTGHSQGGGHAAYLGQMYPLRRVIQLASTCDAVGNVPAPWTSASLTWATSPATSFVGFAAPTTFSSSGSPNGGDTICPYHLAVWQNMGVDPSRQHDDAATCGQTGNTHGVSINCADNFARWGTLFQ